jgi:DNA polymerase-3 subunit delta'
MVTLLWTDGERHISDFNQLAARLSLQGCCVSQDTSLRRLCQQGTLPKGRRGCLLSTLSLQPVRQLALKDAASAAMVAGTDRPDLHCACRSSSLPKKSIAFLHDAAYSIKSSQTALPTLRPLCLNKITFQMPFSHIIGQAKALNLLRRALAGGRLAHGYLFTGPEGVGKGSAARALAGKLLCCDRGDGPPCGCCPGCRKFAAGSHPDFLQLQPEGAGIKINQIRELKKALSFPPFERGMRVVIIDETQTMGREAANSLLKLLEEPPPDNLLLLVASDAEPLLDTIISRCQVISFGPLTEEQAAQVIRRTHPHLSLDEVRTMAKLTGGCPGRTDALHSSEVLELHQECLAALKERMGQAEAVEQALDLARRLAELKEELHLFLDLLALFFKDAMTGMICNREPAADHALAAREDWNLPQLSAMVSAVEAARSDLARNCSRALVCEALLLDMFCGREAQ